MKHRASMNRICHFVWSLIAGAWIAALRYIQERDKSASGRKLFVAMLALLAPTVAQTTPIGGQVVSGIGTIAQKGFITTITQSSQNLSLSWQSFNIAKTETVNFLQPSAAAIAVNRIYDTAGTTILGHLNANGQVWLINPNGILFGAGAQVNVGGLVASTLDNISTNGSAVSFSGNGTGSITNNGTIAGHYVAFIGPAVGNNGTISSNLGAVALGGGSAVTLTFAGLDLVKMQVDRSVLNSLAQNGGLIQANGGMVILSAGARDSLLASVVNNTGIIEARTVNDQSGTITLLGGMSTGTVNVGGILDASAPNGGNGGSIETSARNVKIANDAKVTTLAASGPSGTWLIDPVDFTIAASGGNETGAQLSTALGSGNVTIQSSNGTSGTAGDINVNDTVSWSANTTLTLNAVNNININSSITATGASSAVALYYGQGAVNSGNTATYSFGLTGSGFTGQINLQAGNNFSTKLGSDGSVVSYTVIDSLGTQSSSNDGTLQGMQGNLAGNYVLGANIDATGTSTWNSNTGFTPIGNSTTNFTGAFDGLGHTISSLTINQPAAYRIGMFGVVSSGAAIRNVGLVGGSASGYQFVGELVGVNSGTISNVYTTGGVSGGGGAQSTTGGLVGQNSGTISNAYTTGNVNGGGAVGGFVGKNFSTISYSYTTGKVTGSGNYVGGLAGHNYGASSAISNSYATGNVSGGAYVGGLSGENYNGTISNSYATGSVSGGGNVGGLVGTSNHPISNSHATGSVSGTYNVGGLVGTNNGTLSNGYATGNVNGSSTSYTAVGGLVGWNYATVSNSYATGNVSGPQWIGGLIGYNYGAGSTVSNSYSTGGVSGSSYVGGLAGLNSGTISNAYATGSVSGSTYLGGLVGSSSGTVTNSFWDTATSGQATSAGGTGMATADMMTQANFTSATPANGYVNPGWDFTNTWVMYDGYTYPLLRFFMTPLTVTANNASKTYDGLVYSGGAGVTYSVTPNSNLLGSISYGGSSQGAVNAGSYAITPSGFYSNQQGYDISYASGTLTVNQAPLTVTANNASKTYGQTAAFAGTAFTSSGLQNSETIGSVTETSTGSASTSTVAGGPYAIVPSSATGGTFRAYLNRPVARQVMMPQARCNMAINVSGSFSQRTKMRRNRFIQL